MTSFARSAIDRLTTIIEKRNDDELVRFLSTEKGFRRSQVRKSRVFHRCTPKGLCTGRTTRQATSHPFVGA